MQLTLARPTFLAELPPGEAGIRLTLQAMRALVRASKRSDIVRSTALELTQGLRPKDWVGEIRALFEYTRDRIRYVRDISGLETLQTPLVTMDLEAGDCDDKSALLASLLEAIGHPTRFIAVGFRNPYQYSHVYVETRVGPRWIALDPTMSGAAVGWFPPRALARMVVHN